MLFQIKTGQKTVATAGTQLPLTTTKVMASGLVITALAGNTGAVAIGDADVDMGTGHVLAAGASLDVGELLARIAPKSESNDPVVVDLSKLYVDAATNGDKVSFSYWERAAQ